MEQIRRLDAASTRWNDYVGTAAADDQDTLPGQRSLYELADLDRSRWTIAGFDLAIVDGDVTVTAYAVDRGESGDLDLDQLIADNGYLPVTPFTLADGGDAFLREAFRRVSVRMMASSLRNEQLAVAPHPAGS